MRFVPYYTFSDEFCVYVIIYLDEFQVQDYINCDESAGCVMELTRWEFFDVGWTRPVV
jgi:hypothetical protein